MADKRQLNKAEKGLVFDLDNLGMSRDHLCEFFDVSDKSIYKYIREQRAVSRSDSYTLEETAAVMTRYLLASLARNMHKLTEEQKLRFLPDLLKVKDQIKSEDGIDIKMYTPRKQKTKQEDVIIESVED